jgi:hypothetical protein
VEYRSIEGQRTGTASGPSGVPAPYLQNIFEIDRLQINNPGGIDVV